MAEFVPMVVLWASFLLMASFQVQTTYRRLPRSSPNPDQAIDSFLNEVLRQKEYDGLLDQMEPRLHPTLLRYPVLQELWDQCTWNSSGVRRS